MATTSPSPKLTPAADLPDDVTEWLGPGDDALRESIRREMRITAAAVLFAERRVSIGRAAMIAGLSTSEMIDEVAKREIDVFDVDLDELRREIGLD